MPRQTINKKSIAKGSPASSSDSRKMLILSVSAQFFSFINMIYKRSVLFIRTAQNWLVQRPAAIRKWIKEDKKKKKYRSFRLQKKIRPEPRYIPSSFQLLKETFKFLLKFKRVFVAMIFIHGLVYVAVIRTPITTDVESIQSTIQSALGEEGGIKASVATFGAVLGSLSGGQSDASATTTVTISVIFMSLVYIWAVRQLHMGKLIKARDAFYQGMTPLLSAAVLLLIASIQLIPFAGASFFYTVARSGNVFVSGFEDLAFFLLAALVSLLSFYWVTSTVIGMYVVTLPGMYPLQALRSSRKLVQFQRLTVFRRVFALPIIIASAYTILLFLLIQFLSSQALIIAELLQIVMLPIVHIYLYKLYRGLI